MEAPDYYEFLQISPNAEPDTIHRVYRFLAARLHPDNPKTGDPEKFFLLKQAYDVLSNPERRTEYDVARQTNPPQPIPLSTTIDFMDTMEGELNRRLAVLAMLYIQRRTNPNNPEVSLHEVERRMGFPRDYLDFTTWYLRNKGYITRADNSDFCLTADGVDFVESRAGRSQSSVSCSPPGHRRMPPTNYRPIGRSNLRRSSWARAVAGRADQDSKEGFRLLRVPPCGGTEATNP